MNPKSKGHKIDLPAPSETTRSWFFCFGTEPRFGFQKAKMAAASRCRAANSADKDGRLWKMRATSRKWAVYRNRAADTDWNRSGQRLSGCHMSHAGRKKNGTWLNEADLAEMMIVWHMVSFFVMRQKYSGLLHDWRLQCPHCLCSAATVFQHQFLPQFTVNRTSEKVENLPDPDLIKCSNSSEQKSKSPKCYSCFVY